MDGPFLVIDQGGHATRALLMRADRTRIGEATVATTAVRIDDERVEEDPDELVRSIHDAVRAVLKDTGVAARTIRSAGMAVQRASVVCWDRETGQALSPVLSWQDRRASDLLVPLAERASEIRSRTGMFLSPHYGAGKLRWCLERLEPVRQAADAGRLLMGPLASFLGYRLLDSHPAVAEPATAGRTLLWNRHTLDWDPELLDWFGIPPVCMPACTLTQQRHGEALFQGTPIPLELLAGDQNAAVYGGGVPDPDEVIVNLGTGAFVLRRFDEDPGLAPGLLTGVGYRGPDRTDHHVEGTVNGAGSALTWLATEHGIPDLTDRLGPWLDLDPEPPLFLNGISGLGSPFWRHAFPSRFVGDFTADLCAVAVVESVVFLLAVNLEAMRAVGPPIAKIRASGGLSRWNGLCRRLADLSGIDVEREPDPEATSRGVAFLLSGGRDERGLGETPESFTPRGDPGLESRYRRWRRAMDDALAALPTGPVDA